ncbi:MAG: ribosome biogenesis GTP-binding protein YihA/YsxC [Spirochaetota bacterium]
MTEIKNSSFVLSSNGSSFPKEDLPEFAFVGRSNCGKSSLINMILNRKNLVKTGSTPGMTKLANYFLVNQSAFLVDLPGYGFAKVPVKEKKKLEALIYRYIDARAHRIRAFFLLMDIRRLPAEEERTIMKLLAKKNVPVAFTVTKADKLSRSKREKQIADIRRTLEIESDRLFVTSTHTREGRDSLLDVLEPYL